MGAKNLCDCELAQVIVRLWTSGFVSWGHLDSSARVPSVSISNAEPSATATAARQLPGEKQQNGQGGSGPSPPFALVA